MAKPNNKKEDGKTTSSTTITTTSHLPGLDGVKVIVSEPDLIKENSSKIRKK